MVKPSDRIAHYRLEGELGRGGMGVVYRAVDERLDRPVALKVIRADELYAGEDLERARARFQREARLAARLSHPNVVTVYSYERHGDLDLIAMELVEGETLAERLARGERWSPEEAAHLLAQVADGVAAAHAAGIVHRDLKPANVMVLPDGRVKVLDFGVAKGTVAGLGADVTATGTVFGTVNYMAPEQVLGREVGPPTDVFSLGSILYEMVTGERAFGQGAPVSVGMRVANEAPRLLTEDGEGKRMFGRLWPVLTRLLAKEPSKRFPHADAVREALERAYRDSRTTGSTRRDAKPGAGGLVAVEFGWRGLRVAAWIDAQVDLLAEVEYGSDFDLLSLVEQRQHGTDSAIEVPPGLLTDVKQRAESATGRTFHGIVCSVPAAAGWVLRRALTKCGWHFVRTVTAPGAAAVALVHDRDQPFEGFEGDVVLYGMGDMHEVALATVKDRVIKLQAVRTARAEAWSPPSRRVTFAASAARFRNRRENEWLDGAELQIGRVVCYGDPQQFDRVATDLRTLPDAPSVTFRPDVEAAIGAVHVANSLNAKGFGVLVDILPVGLGLTLSDGSAVPVIEQFSPIPARRTAAFWAVVYNEGVVLGTVEIGSPLESGLMNEVRWEHIGTEHMFVRASDVQDGTVKIVDVTFEVDANLELRVSGQVRGHARGTPRYIDNDYDAVHAGVFRYGCLLAPCSA